MGAADELPCLKPSRGGASCELSVQVVPKAAHTAVAGLHDGTLRLRVAAPPIDGRANAELLRWLARELGLPRQAVTLAGGESSRRKRVHLQASSESVTAWLRAQLVSMNSRAP